GPSSFASDAARDDSAQYAPVWTRTHGLKRFASRRFACSIHVLSSTPGAAVFFSFEEACPQNLNVEVMKECRQLVLSVPGDGFSYAGTASGPCFAAPHSPCPNSQLGIFFSRIENLGREQSDRFVTSASQTIIAVSNTAMSE